MTQDEVIFMAHAGQLNAAGGVTGACPLCSEPMDDEPTLVHARRAVHASCAAGVIASARRSAGHEPIRGVSGVVCGICHRSFRHADQVVLVGREGCKAALHVRACRRVRAKEKA